jgi:alpha-galactosidase
VERSPNGTINVDPVRFPGGMTPLIDYIHSQGKGLAYTAFSAVSMAAYVPTGLKFGIYTAQREFTCQRRPGSFQHEAIDVDTYCDWGGLLVTMVACC